MNPLIQGSGGHPPDYKPGASTKTVSQRGMGQYTTLAEAKAAAGAGDTIEVLDGTYTERTNLFGDLRWYFNSGVRVVQSCVSGEAPDNGYGVFDDRDAAATCLVDGDGEFHIECLNAGVDSNVNFRGLIVLTRATSQLYFRGRKLTGTTDNDIPEAEALIHMTNGAKCVVNVEEMLDTVGVGSVLYGCYWEVGELHVNVKRAVTAQSCFWFNEPVGNVVTQNAWVTADYLEAVAQADGVCYFSGLNNFYRAWVVAKEIKAATNFGAVSTLGTGGRFYVTAQKLSNSVAGKPAVSLDGAVEVWLDAQKVSSKAVGIETAAGFTGKLYAYVIHIDDEVGMTAACKFAGTGEVNLSGHLMTVLDGDGLSLIGAGRWRVKGFRIDTTNTNAAGNNPVLLGNATTGLVLEQCVLLAPALADSVEAAVARTIASYGSFANKAADGNVTIAAGGALTVNAAVV